MLTASVRALAVALGICTLTVLPAASEPGALHSEPQLDPIYEPPRTSDGRPNLEGVWSYSPPMTNAGINRGQLTSWITRPASGQIPWRVAARMERMFPAASRTVPDNTGPEQRSLGERCLVPNAGPPFAPATLENAYHIVQTRTHIAIDMNSDVRIARIGGKARPSAIRPWFGDSIARWDGDALVIETRHIHPLQERLGAYPLSPRGVVTETFRRVSDQELLYQVRVNDPDYYYAVWSGEMVLRRSDKSDPDHSCHESNTALPAILRDLGKGNSASSDTSAIAAIGEDAFELAGGPLSPDPLRVLVERRRSQTRATALRE
jgi:hypothetical protein